MYSSHFILFSALLSGYFIATTLLTTVPVTPVEVAKPAPTKALYINYWAASSKKYQKNLFKLIEATDINALVVDIKNEFGELAYHYNQNNDDNHNHDDLPHTIGAHRKSFIKDYTLFLAPFKQRGLYLIARLSVFKDHLLANQRPDWAVKTKEGQLWHDQQGIAWTDPFIDEVQQYNLQIALDVMKMGFDEVHFDYIRFPGVNGLLFHEANTQQNRVDAISIFLERNRLQLAGSRLKVSVATYGYSCWNSNDTYIGHQVHELASQVDYLSPMLYPSSFHLGIPGHRNPVKSPYEIVLYTLQSCAQNAGYPPEKFRPWLQAFSDYAFDKRKFGVHEVAQQIKAAVDFKASGWMLWNPASHYPVRGVFSKQQD